MTAFEEVDEPVDLVFDTAGGERLAKSAEALRPGGKLVTVTEEPPVRAPTSSSSQSATSWSSSARSSSRACSPPRSTRPSRSRTPARPSSVSRPAESEAKVVLEVAAAD